MRYGNKKRNPKNVTSRPTKAVGARTDRIMFGGKKRYVALFALACMLIAVGIAVGNSRRVQAVQNGVIKILDYSTLTVQQKSEVEKMYQDALNACNVNSVESRKDTENKVWISVHCNNSVPRYFEMESVEKVVFDGWTAAGTIAAKYPYREGELYTSTISVTGVDANGNYKAPIAQIDFKYP